MKPHWNPFDWLKDKGRGEIQLIGSTVIRSSSGVQTLIGSGSPIYKLFGTGRLIFLQLCTPENHTSPIVVIHTDKVLILHIPVAQNTFFLSFFFYFITFAPQNEDKRNDGTPLESGCVNMYIIKISDL